MTKKRIKEAIHRLREMMTGSLIMSVVVCIFCISGPMPVGSVQRDITLAILPVIYIIWNVFMLRRSYKKIKKIKSYYVISLCATAAFVFISVIAFFTFPRKFYSWFFLVTCLAGFSNVKLLIKLSLPMFYIVIFASVFLAPIGMGWVKRKAEEKKLYIEKMPPKLVIEKEKQAEEK